MSTSSPSSPSSPTFTSLLTHLQTTYPPPLISPPKPYNPSLTHTISSLSLHPTLETILHILNGDLPAAHFLVRHMQAAPQYEGMLLHGVLHRCEGDFDNARAWYGDVKGQGEKEEEERGVYVKVCGVGKEERGDEAGEQEKKEEKDDGQALIDKVEAWRKRGEGSEEEVGRECGEEMARLAKWCVKKFGEGEWKDVSGVWCQPGGEQKEVKDRMIIGGEGWRKF